MAYKRGPAAAGQAAVRVDAAGHSCTLASVLQSASAPGRAAAGVAHVTVPAAH